MQTDFKEKVEEEFNKMIDNQLVGKPSTVECTEKV
jgi:hypothetical protein